MAYADRKNLTAKLRELPHDIHAKIDAERRRLWRALHEITKQHGGKVVAPPCWRPRPMPSLVFLAIIEQVASPYSHVSNARQFDSNLIRF